MCIGLHGRSFALCSLNGDVCSDRESKPPRTTEAAAAAGGITRDNEADATAYGWVYQRQVSKVTATKRISLNVN